MKKCLLVAESHDSKGVSANLSLITAAKLLQADIDMLVVAENDNLAREMTGFTELKNVLCITDSRLAAPLAEDVAPILVELAKDYDALLFNSTTYGKNIMPRVAGILGIQPISDVVKIIDSEHYVRPIFAGNAFEEIEYTEDTKLISIRPTSFEPASSNGGAAQLHMLELPFKADPRVEFVQLFAPQSDRPDLMNAKIVVSGGRALKSAENFKLIEQLADKLHAAVGASRAAVDAGFVPNDFQVGQTGKIVAPDLYIAIGISGAIQHLAGIKDSKVIVAINKDEEAPIFEVADYGLVGDLFQVIPELLEKL